jgi:protein SCO1
MHPRLRLAAVLGATLALGLIAVVATLARPDRPGASAGLEVGAAGFVGAARPAIPPQDFTLRDERGRTVRLSDFRGRVVALTFLYATCEDTCPTTAAQLGAALDDAGGEVPALAVSVDPEGDTPQNASRFLVERGLRGRMSFLLGSRAELAPVWKAYGIQPQGEDFEHSAYVLLIDKRGRQRVGHPFGNLTPEGLAFDLRKLQAERA